MTDNNAYFKPHELRYAVGRPAPMANKKKKTTKKKTTKKKKTRGRKKKVVAPETDPDQGTFGDQENDDD